MTAQKLRVVSVDMDVTVACEPAITTWDLNGRAMKIAFWTPQEWATLPKVLRPEDAKPQGDKGWIRISPA